MRRLLTALLITTCPLVACGPAGEAELANEADDAVSVSSTEAALSSELADEVSQPMSAAPEALATSAAARVASRLTPAGCATSTQAGATVTYVLNDCSGPYGLVNVTGTIVAQYARAPGGGVQVTLTSTGLKANRATLDLAATVRAQAQGGVKRAQVEVDALGTGPRGTPLRRQGSYAVIFDATAQCFTLEGTWETTVAGASASTQVSGYQRCAGACPKAGGTVVHTSARGRVTTVRYDGSATASFETAQRSGAVPLLCGGQT